MVQHTSAVIHKADQRKQLITRGTKVFESFGNNLFPGKLLFVNDVFTQAGSQPFVCSKSFNHLVIPVSGYAALEDGTGKMYVDPEEMLYLWNTGLDHHIVNREKQYELNFLHIGFEKQHPVQPLIQRRPAGLEAYNEMTSLNLEQFDGQCYGQMGVFEGRHKSCYTARNKNSCVFVYVINGAFEVADRLVEYRDGLTLWNREQVEFEALSEFAILLIIEQPLGLENN